ncbi:MFS general substrate transporter [Meredithblackwellia eburnea MCA 4105]
MSSSSHPSIDEEKKGTETAGAIHIVTSRAQHHIEKKEKDLDVAAGLATGIELTPAENKRIRNKIDRYLLPPMMILYLVQFMDKTTLGNSVLLGVKTANHLTTVQYNVLSSIFYVSYLLFEWPQAIALQRFPVGKWMSINIMVWAMFLMLHAACKNFAGLFIVRFGLGVCEGSITAGFLIVTSMFYTRVEQGQRVGMWFLMNGTAQCVSGLLSYGIHHIHSKHIQDWQILFLLTGALTFVLGIVWWFIFPDNSATAWFLSSEERGMAIERIRVNQAGTENKVWKRHQFVEALTDVKIWLFVLFSCLDNIPNSLTNQASTIYTELGFSTLTSTLLGIPSGVIEIVTIGSGIILLGKFPNSRAIIGACYFIPNVLGAILVIALPWSDKHGILASLYITGFGTTGFVISLAWLQATTAGHTKRTTAQAMNLVGYCIGNIIGPQVWQAKYAPRNFVPWAVVIVSYSLCPVILLLIRFILNRENKRREALAFAAKADGIDQEEEVVDVKHADGTTTVEKVDKAFLDLTDKENLDYRYCL